MRQVEADRAAREARQAEHDEADPREGEEPPIVRVRVDPFYDTETHTAAEKDMAHRLVRMWKEKSVEYAMRHRDPDETGDVTYRRAMDRYRWHFDQLWADLRDERQRGRLIGNHIRWWTAHYIAREHFGWTQREYTTGHRPSPTDFRGNFMNTHRIPDEIGHQVGDHLENALREAAVAQATFSSGSSGGAGPTPPVVPPLRIEDRPRFSTGDSVGEGNRGVGWLREHWGDLPPTPASVKKTLPPDYTPRVYPDPQSTKPLRRNAAKLRATSAPPDRARRPYDRTFEPTRSTRRGRPGGPELERVDVGAVERAARVLREVTDAADNRFRTPALRAAAAARGPGWFPTPEPTRRGLRRKPAIYPLAPPREAEETEEAEEEEEEEEEESYEEEAVPTVKGDLEAEWEAEHPDDPEVTRYAARYEGARMADIDSVRYTLRNLYRDSVRHPGPFMFTIRTWFQLMAMERFHDHPFAAQMEARMQRALERPRNGDGHPHWIYDWQEMDETLYIVNHRWAETMNRPGTVGHPNLRTDYDFLVELRNALFRPRGGPPGAPLDIRTIDHRLQQIHKEWFEREYMLNQREPPEQRRFPRADPRRWDPWRTHPMAPVMLRMVLQLVQRAYRRTHIEGVTPRWNVTDPFRIEAMFDQWTDIEDEHRDLIERYQDPAHDRFELWRDPDLGFQLAYWYGHTMYPDFVNPDNTAWHTNMLHLRIHHQVLGPVLPPPDTNVARFSRDPFAPPHPEGLPVYVTDTEAYVNTLDGTVAVVPREEDASSEWLIGPTDSERSSLLSREEAASLPQLPAPPTPEPEVDTAAMMRRFVDTSGMANTAAVTTPALPAPPQPQPQHPSEAVALALSQPSSTTRRSRAASVDAHMRITGEKRPADAPLLELGDAPEPKTGRVQVVPKPLRPKATAQQRHENALARLVEARAAAMDILREAERQRALFLNYRDREFPSTEIVPDSGPRRVQWDNTRAEIEYLDQTIARGEAVLADQLEQWRNLETRFNRGEAVNYYNLHRDTYHLVEDMRARLWPVPGRDRPLPRYPQRLLAPPDANMQENPPHLADTQALYDSWQAYAQRHPKPAAPPQLLPPPPSQPEPEAAAFRPSSLPPPPKPKPKPQAIYVAESPVSVASSQPSQPVYHPPPAAAPPPQPVPKPAAAPIYVAESPISVASSQPSQAPPPQPVPKPAAPAAEVDTAAMMRRFVDTSGLGDAARARAAEGILATEGPPAPPAQVPHDILNPGRARLQNIHAPLREQIARIRPTPNRWRDFAQHDAWKMFGVIPERPGAPALRRDLNDTGNEEEEDDSDSQGVADIADVPDDHPAVGGRRKRPYRKTGAFKGQFALRKKYPPNPPP